VGVRPIPGSTGRRAEDGSDGPRRFDHLARYAAPGAVVINEETGEYSEYEVPEENGVPLDWADVLAHPRLIAADFQSEYGIDLAAVGNTLPWRRFADLVAGLLACDSRIWRQMKHETEPDKTDEEVPDDER
jgi:Bacteriophage Gp15 protein